MISATDLYNKYKGKTVGTNSSDTGECVGWYNVGIREQLVLGGYVIQGAYGAKDLLTATNTRPDLIEQVKNNPNDKNQKPSAGDWLVWGGNLPGSGGYGHVGLVLSTPPGFIITADQNWGGRTVHEVKHDWNYVTGWIHHRVPAPIAPPVDPCATVKAENVALKAEVVKLKDQTVALNNQVKVLESEKKVLQDKTTELGKVIDNQKAEIERLNAQLKLCSSDTEGLDKLSAALKWLFVRLNK
jgi:hypothetical protein